MDLFKICPLVFQCSPAAQVHPGDQHVDESLNTLEYAARARNIKMKLSARDEEEDKVRPRSASKCRSRYFVLYFREFSGARSVVKGLLGSNDLNYTTNYLTHPEIYSALSKTV